MFLVSLIFLTEVSTHTSYSFTTIGTSFMMKSNGQFTAQFCYSSVLSVVT